MKKVANYNRVNADSQSQDSLSLEAQRLSISVHALSLGYEMSNIIKLVYPAVFTPFSNTSGYTVEVPDLSGCISEGSSLVDTIEKGTDAACGWLIGELEAGRDIPTPSAYNNIHPQPGSFVNLLVLDISDYAEKHGNKSVRRNVTLPAWLDTFASSNDINCSKVLQNALLTLAQSHK